MFKCNQVVVNEDGEKPEDHDNRKQNQQWEIHNEDNPLFVIHGCMRNPARGAGTTLYLFCYRLDAIRVVSLVIGYGISLLEQKTGIPLAEFLPRMDFSPEISNLSLINHIKIYMELSDYYRFY